MEFFDYIKNFFNKKIELTSDSPDHVNLWMVNRFLSGSPIAFEYCMVLNRYMSKIPAWASGMYLFTAIPHLTRAPWLSYGKKVATPYPPELIAKISQYFCCSEMTAIQYIYLIEKREDPYKLFGLKRKKSNGAKNKKKKKAAGKKSSKKNDRLPRNKK